MSKIAFIFPGQGSQYVGMGKDFYDTYEESKAVYKLASEVTGLDIEKLCFEENPQLNETEYTQIAMLATEIAILQAVLKENIKGDICAGLSLGEYGALSYSEAIELRDLLKLVRNRGIYMQNAYPTGGAMTAVLGLDDKKVVEVVEATGDEVYVANFNCPGQIVISGKAPAVEKAAAALKEAGAKRCIPLKVSGPFHSPLLNKASEQLQKDLETVKISKPKVPYYTNVGAALVTDEKDIANLLTRQVVSSVMWQQSVENMVNDGVDTFIEIGPGKSLQGFIKKIAPQTRAFSIQTVEDLEKLKAEI